MKLDAGKPPFESLPQSGPPSDEARDFAVTVERLLNHLSPENRDAARRAVLKRLTQIDRPRAGELVGQVLQLFREDPARNVPEIKAALQNRGVQAPPRAVYNVLGHLARQKRIKNMGYGQYALLESGAGIVSADLLCGEPHRHNEEGPENP